MNKFKLIRLLAIIGVEILMWNPECLAMDSTHVPDGSVCEIMLDYYRKERQRLEITLYFLKQKKEPKQEEIKQCQNLLEIYKSNEEDVMAKLSKTFKKKSINK